MRKIYLLIIAVLLTFPHMRAAAMADTAKAACLVNAVTGEVLFEKNKDEKLPMASTTKIMTLVTAIEKTNPEDVVTVPHEAVMEEGSSAYLEEGAKISMHDLCCGLMLNSGNDAAVAIAYHISGGKEEFAREMNDTARRIGAENTSFKNPNGLDEDGHYTTAYDLAKITRYALSLPEFREIVGMRIYTASYIRADGTEASIEYINHNRLLREFDGCIGVKTGFTKKDGRCLVSAAERDGAVYIAVTLNASNDWNEHKEMLEEAFGSCRMVNAVKAGDCIRHVVNDSDECRLVAASDFYVPVNGERGRAFEVEEHIPDDIYMPLNEGEKIGELSVYCDGVNVGTVDVVADRDFKAEGKAKVKSCFVFYVQTLIRNIL